MASVVEPCDGSHFSTIVNGRHVSQLYSYARRDQSIQVHHRFARFPEERT